MKMRLPKVLVLALFAATSMAQAGYVTPTTITTASGEMALGTKASEVGGYTIDLKDGVSTEATVTKNVETSSALYVREGTVVIGGTSTHNTVMFSMGAAENNTDPNRYYDSSWSPIYLNIAGNSAKVVIDNATVTSATGNLDTGLGVGGPDGGGTLIIQNGGKYLGGNQGYFQIGYQSHRKDNAKLVTDKVPVHATTKTPDSANRIVIENADGSKTSEYDFGNRYEGGQYATRDEREFGRAVVTVTGEGSLLETSQYGLGMGHGELNILDDAVCNSKYFAHNSYGVGCVTSIGYADDCESVVNVKGGAVWNIHNQLHTGNGANSSTVFNVENATVNLLDMKGSFLGLGTSSTPESYDYSDNGSTTTLNLLEGAKLNVSEEMYVGYTSKATITVASTAEIHDFDNKNDSGSALDRLIVNEAGSIENKGKINILTDIRGGKVTLDSGCSMEDILMSDGDICVNGYVTAGAIELTGGTITFSYEALEAQIALADDVPGAMLTANSLTLGDGLKIVVELSDFNSLAVGNTFSLFALATDADGEISGLEKTEIIFTDGSATKTATVKVDGGSVTVTDIVPEPTTATLSLLALAGLAARRRRK